MWAHVQDNKMTSFQTHPQGHKHPLHACIKRRDNLQHIWLPHELLGLLDNACHFLMLRLMLISSCSALAVSGLLACSLGHLQHHGMYTQPYVQRLSSSGSSLPSLKDWQPLIW